MNFPKVSVITPTYNSAKDIEACIASVAQQTYINKEHLIIDNQSCDGTLDIAQKYALLYPHIQCIAESDQGIYDAMNKGIERSTGEWLYFLGSDDVLYDNDVLADLFYADETRNNDVIYGNVEWGPNGAIYDGEFSFVKLIHKNICHQAIFFRRSVFERLGRFDLRYKVLADWAFNLLWISRDDIPKSYRQRVIATYGLGGYSATHHDPVFHTGIRDIVGKHYPEVFLLLFDRCRAVEERDLQIASLSHEVALRDQRLSDLYHDPLLASLSHEVAVRDQLIASLSHEIAVRDHQIGKMTNSSSWRMTKPIRKLTNSVRKRSRKIRNKFFPKPWLLGNDPNRQHNDYQQWIASFDTRDEEQLQQITTEISEMASAPLISVIMPVYNPAITFLDEAIRSVRNQLYTNWELSISDDCSPDPEVRALIEAHMLEDNRITCVFRKENGHISLASNSALDVAKGEYSALLDHDDLLHPLALYWIAKELINHPDAALIYSDEDKIDASGQRVGPYFKCDFNYDLLLCQNMISHLGVYKTSLIREIGGFREGMEGSQDYDIALRTVEQLRPEQIRHIPRVLYHWRIHDLSTAATIAAKPYARIAAMAAVKSHLERTSINATVEEAPDALIFNRIRYAIPYRQPSVEIIIQSGSNAVLLNKCVLSILTKTTWQNYHLTIVDTSHNDETTQSLLSQWENIRNIVVIRDAGSPCNYAAINNRAATASHADYISLINSTIELISPDWLNEMVGYALQKGVGAVGARLWDINHKLHHGGIIIGLNGGAGYLHKDLPKGDPGYFARGCLQQSFSAVTGACMLLSRANYLAVEGLDEELALYNDIDLCLKLQEQGLRTVWTPYAEMFHHESDSNDARQSLEKQEQSKKELLQLQTRWASSIKNDPAYSPNLSLHTPDFSYAWPPRLD